MDTQVASETLIGKPCRIRPEALDPMTQNPHMWAGKYGQIDAVTPLGALKVAVGSRTKLFDLGELEIVSETPPAETPQAQAQPQSQDSNQPRLVYEPPLMAINSPTNPRRRRGLDVDSLAAFAENLRRHKVKSPILVRPLPSSRLEETADLNPRPAYEIVAGERRWRGAQIAELDVMPMLVEQLSDEEVLEIQLIENIEREDLDAMEEAEGFAMLRERLGYTVEQIAERMGKGRGPSYVRKRMRLLDLTPESREAMYDGTLQLSTGLLVARYPADKQAEVVKHIASLGEKGDPAPFREVATALFRRFNLVLAQAAFEIADAELVPGAGACAACPKRTGANADLFGDGEITSDSCTDSACWDSKKAAHIQRIRSSAEARGMKVMDEDEARKLLNSPYSTYTTGFTKLNDVAYTDKGNDGVEREVTFADALRGMGRKAPKPIVIIHPHTSQAIEVIPDDLAEKLVPPPVQDAMDKRHQRMAPMDTRPPEHKALQRHDVRRAALLRAFDVIRARDRTVEELRLIAYSVWESEPELTEDYLGWSADLDDLDDYREQVKVRRQKIDAMNSEQLAQAIVMASLEWEVTSNIPEWDHTTSRAVQAVEVFGIDILAVQDKVDEDLQRAGQEAGDTAEGADAEEEEAA